MDFDGTYLAAKLLQMYVHERPLLWCVRGGKLTQHQPFIHLPQTGTSPCSWKPRTSRTTCRSSCHGTCSMSHLPPTSVRLFRLTIPLAFVGCEHINQVRGGCDASRGEGGPGGRGGNPRVLPRGGVHRARARQQRVGDARDRQHADGLVAHERARGDDARTRAPGAHIRAQASGRPRQRTLKWEQQRSGREGGQELSPEKQQQHGRDFFETRQSVASDSVASLKLRGGECNGRSCAHASQCFTIVYSRPIVALSQFETAQRDATQRLSE